MAERPEAAQPSFMRALCMGDIEESLIFPYPELPESGKEVLRDVLGSVDSLMGNHAADFRHWDAKGEFPDAFIEELRQFGMFGLVIPEEHGGLGFGSAAYSRTLQQVARYDASVAVTIGAHSSIGMRGLLLFGSPKQRETYYPELASGKRIAAFCLTEPGSGSDASSIRTTAEQEGDHWVLNGEKLWITNGGYAGFFTVFAKTSSEGSGRMTAFLVTPEMGGVTAGPHEDKMGIRASSTTTVTFDGTRVPADHVLGDVGAGFKVAMAILNNGRTGLGGGSVGAMKHVIGLASQHARDRKQFGKPIAEFGLVKQKLGRMLVDCYAAESVVNLVAHMIDSKSQDYAVEAAISKVFASEALWRVADEALQIAAGVGYMRELPYERVVRDARIMRIFEGTNEILRLFVALTAMSDVSSQLQELSSGLKGAFNDPIKGFGVLTGYALKQAGLRGLGQSKAKLASVPEPLRDVTIIFEESTRQLAQGADRILRKHGRAIIGKQLATRRLADIMIDLFVLGAMLSRVGTNLQRHGVQAVEKETAILRSYAGQARARIQRNFARIDDNEDELIKTLGDYAVEREGYPWDVL
ncbi:MAG: acyl-CoA dehydrogenase domain protein [Myxococcaceae bacterium]|nr:acyl-CoA dehydrogenase domain protein [Myxococcaceae bacterium]